MHAAWNDSAMGAQRVEAWDHQRLVRCFAQRPKSFISLLEKAKNTHAHKKALVFEQQHWTYQETWHEVLRCAQALASLGIGPQDRVLLFVSNRPEFVFVLFAIQYLGAIAVPVGIREQKPGLSYIMNQCTAKAIVFDEALQDRIPAFSDVASLAHRIALDTQHTTDDVISLNALCNSANNAPMACAVTQEFDTAVILYTSGTTGKPKGILHTSGGYLTQAAYTHKNVFDLHAETDVYWCTADVGWITGHSYVVYGPLANGATQVIYEGTPDSPHAGRWWEIIEKYGVSIFYTAPTAIRSFMKQGREIPDKFNLKSLRVLGSVGEPINPEAWMWYRDVIGGGKCPIVDTWWQTETGAIMISPLPGLTTLTPGSAQLALPGINMAVVNDDGRELENGHGGYLVITEPWPSMLRGIWKNPDRYKEGYWSRFPSRYFAGDGAKLDQEGNLWVLGRVDDVLNVSGHRLSTAEIESALVAHEWVAEAAVVGASDELTGQSPVAFVILRTDQIQAAGDDKNINAVLRNWVAKEIGPIAKPRQIMVVPELPKTRSGKIMRRLLRDVAEQREVGDTTTLADVGVMSLITSKLATGASD